MKTLGRDQSATVRCVKHGRNAPGVFFRPEYEEFEVADYLCLHCWLEAGSPARLSVTEFFRLRYPETK